MITHVIAGVLALFAGAAVAAGAFAFWLMIGILPRMIKMAGAENHILLLENLTVLGLLYGNIKSTVDWSFSLPFGHAASAVFGLFCGIYVGQVAASLAEILHTFPILFRRLKIKGGLSCVMTAMALGKLAGSLYYFLGGYVV